MNSPGWLASAAWTAVEPAFGAPITNTSGRGMVAPGGRRRLDEGWRGEEDEVDGAAQLEAQPLVDPLGTSVGAGDVQEGDLAPLDDLVGHVLGERGGHPSPADAG